MGEGKGLGEKSEANGRGRGARREERSEEMGERGEGEVLREGGACEWLEELLLLHLYSLIIMLVIATSVMFVVWCGLHGGYFYTCTTWQSNVQLNERANVAKKLSLRTKHIGT